MNLKLPHGLQDSTGHGHGHGFWGSKNPESLLRSPNLENDPLSMSGILLLLRAMVILWLHRVFGVRICSSYRLLHLVSPAWQQHSPLFTTTFSLTPVTTITSLVCLSPLSFHHFQVPNSSLYNCSSKWHCKLQYVTQNV
jgi:hypothetical protein